MWIRTKDVTPCFSPSPSLGVRDGEMVENRVGGGDGGHTQQTDEAARIGEGGGSESDIGVVAATWNMGDPSVRRHPHTNSRPLLALRRLLRGCSFSSLRLPPGRTMRLLCKGSWGFPLILDRQVTLSPFAPFFLSWFPCLIKLFLYFFGYL